MNKFFVLSAIVCSIFFFACEDDTIPIPLPPSQPSASAPVNENAGKTESKAPAGKPSEPAKTAKSSTKEKPSAKEPIKTVTYFDGDADQLTTGRYIIQVGIFPIEASARKVIKKLADNGIKAYNAKVDNPDPEKGMIGTYNRVRVGFFNAKSSAEAFAKAKLEPLGYSWWIDRSKYDNIGKLASSEPEPVFEVERIQEQPKQMSEQERKEAERAAAIAKAKEEYKAIAKAANASVSVPPPSIPPKASKAAPPPAPQAQPPKLAASKTPTPAAKEATQPAAKASASTNQATKEAEIDSRGKVKMKKKSQ